MEPMPLHTHGFGFHWKVNPIFLLSPFSNILFSVDNWVFPIAFSILEI